MCASNDIVVRKMLCVSSGCSFEKKNQSEIIMKMPWCTTIYNCTWYYPRMHGIATFCLQILSVWKGVANFKCSMFITQINPGNMYIYKSVYDVWNSTWEVSHVACHIIKCVMVEWLHLHVFVTTFIHLRETIGELILTVNNGISYSYSEYHSL